MKYKIPELTANELFKDIEVDGVVVDTNPRDIFLDVAVYECRYCGYITNIKQTGPYLVKPTICENDVCGRKGKFLFKSEKSVWKDIQRISIIDYESYESIAKTDGGLCGRHFDDIFLLKRLSVDIIGYESIQKIPASSIDPTDKFIKKLTILGILYPDGFSSFVLKTQDVVLTEILLSSSLSV